MAHRSTVLLFDLVGTLIDEASDYEALDVTMEAARARFGLAVDAAELSGDFSLALMEILRAEDPPGGEGAPVGKAEFVPFEQAAKEIFAAVLEVRGIDATPEDVAWFWRTFVDVQRKVVRPTEDARVCLEWAREQGFAVWVVTDADPYFVTDVMPSTGLDKLWDGIVTAAEAGDPKPEPAIFLLALTRAGASPSEVVMIGDSYERDVLGARAVGIHRGVLVDRAPSEVVMIGDSYERDVLGARAVGIHRGVLVDRHRARTVDDVPVISSLTALPAALSTVVPTLN